MSFIGKALKERTKFFGGHLSSRLGDSSTRKELAYSGNHTLNLILLFWSFGTLNVLVLQIYKPEDTE